MKFVDIVQMLGNLTRSLEQVAYLVGGISYLSGLVFIIIGLLRFKKIGASGRQSQETPATPLAFIAGGAALLFLPNTMHLVSNTTFGNYNVLQYTNYNPYNIYQSIIILINTMGLIWFVRGTVMVVVASKPGHQAGYKGLFYLIAGVLALNFKLSMQFINYAVEQLANVSITVKNVAGF